MLFRLIAVFACVVIFINGCNSLISQFVGTHKLRFYEMGEVVQNGLGDADYVEINNAWTTGDFIYAPPVRTQKKGLIIFPVLSEQQMKAFEKGEIVEVQLMGWSEDYSKECLEAQNCMPKQKMKLIGIMRDIPKEKNKVDKFSSEQYQLSKNIFFMEKDRAPLEWYYNLAIMLGVLALGFGIEYYNLKKSKVKSNE